MSLVGMTVAYFIITLLVSASFTFAAWLMVKECRLRRKMWVIGAYVVLMSLYMTYVPVGYILFLNSWG